MSVFVYLWYCLPSNCWFGRFSHHYVTGSQDAVDISDNRTHLVIVNAFGNKIVYFTQFN